VPSIRAVIGRETGVDQTVVSTVMKQHRHLMGGNHLRDERALISCARQRRRL
jgi:hypothetical protein